ncbi:type II toxin-antitoxin system HipA family toxin [Pseudomonas protegens]|uniref:type II toxin-antitoxin system HipA family toxin n=1 Tax=Pseudomonas protegens TaxID=380021 RepID=UPI0006439AEC|nr:HipA domain-containing protein [Pseudomonas protegens]
MTLIFEHPEQGFTSPCRLGYEQSYLAGNLEAFATPLAGSVSVRLPLTWELLRSPGAPAFLYDIAPTLTMQGFLAERSVGARPAGIAPDLFLLARSSAAPMGNLRIKESLAGMNERPLLGFSRAEVSARDNRFLEYAHEQGAAMSGATGAAGEAPKLLLTQARDGLLYPDALLQDRLAACHWLVKCLPEQATPNDGDMLRSEFHYYRALQQLGIDTVPAQDLALEEERQPSLWMRRFDRRLHGQGVERLALESIYSLAGLPGQSLGMRHTKVLGLLAELWRTAGQASAIPELVADYLRRDLLNKILGNSANHGRNTWIIRQEGQVQLAPIHDLAPRVMDDKGITRSTKWPGRMEVAGDIDWRQVCASLKPLIDPDAALTRLREDAERLRALPDLLSAGGLPEATLNHPRIYLRDLDRRLQEWGLR